MAKARFARDVVVRMPPTSALAQSRLLGMRRREPGPTRAIRIRVGKPVLTMAMHDGEHILPAWRT